MPIPPSDEPVGTKLVDFNPVFSSIPRVILVSGSAGGTDERSWTVLTTVTPAIWTGQPNAVTELFGRTDNRWVMLFPSSTNGNFTCSLIANIMVAGNAGSVLRVQDSPDQTTWTNLQSSPNGDVPMDSVGVQVNNYAGLGNGGLSIGHFPAGPYFRVVGQGGNGVASPQLGNIYFECWWDVGVSTPFLGSVTTSQLIIGVAVLVPNLTVVTVTWIACTVGC